MEWRFIKLEDYDDIAWWWKKHNKSEFFPKTSLPRYGVIISNGGMDTYAGFLYLTGTNLAWVSTIVSNPLAGHEDKKGGIEKLFDVMETVAKINGVEFLFGSTNVKPLVNSYKKNGFTETDKDCSHLYKKI